MHMTFHWSSIDTIALDGLVFKKIAFCVRILATDRQTDRQTALMRKGAFAVASGALM